MAWCENDRNGFQQHCKMNTGQININTTLGNYIYQYAKNDDYLNYLEIGTWNGLGSTKCFIEGLKDRKTETYKFYSLECNDDKHLFAKNLYKNEKNVHILNDVLLNNMPNDIYEIFPDLLINNDYKYWNNIDFNNMKNKKLFFERDDIPEKFDVIFLDGGEFTTWYEYNIIKDKCTVLILDDTNVNKCKKIVQDIKLSNRWKIIIESDERNGFVICEKIIDT